MLKPLRKLLAVLTPRERRIGVLVLVMMMGLALLESAGVASILPFLAVLGDPAMVQKNAALAWLFDRGGFASTQEFLFALGLGAFAVVALSGLFRFLTTYVTLRFVHLRRHSIGARLLQSYLRQPYEFFLDRNSADLSKSILSEADVLASRMIHPAMKMFSYGVILVVLVTLLIVVDAVLAVAAVLVVAAMYGVVYVGVRGVLGRIGAKRLATNRDRFTAASEAFGGIKDLKVLGREDAYVERFSGPSYRNARYKITAATISAAPRYVIEVIGFGGVLALALFLLTTRDSLGEVLPLLGLFTFAAYRILPAAQQVYAGASELRFGVPALDAVYEDLVARAAQDSPAAAEPEPLALEKGIRFRGVSLRYPGSDAPALRGLDFTIPARAAAAFVGTTGAGKTTAVDLILGLLRPSEGEVLVDGAPLAGENVRRWQRSIGYVPQTIYLADATVSQNIAFGVKEKLIDREAVERAAQVANIHGFITSELPLGYATVVGERGVRLSGGQRQRLGIARALYHDPALLVLDEATSALDAPTESAILDAVERLSGDKTLILIAHRMTTVRRCDLIIVLERGSVKATGSFEELSASNEAFRRLAVVP